MRRRCPAAAGPGPISRRPPRRPSRMAWQRRGGGGGGGGGGGALGGAGRGGPGRGGGAGRRAWAYSFFCGSLSGGGFFCAPGGGFPSRGLRRRPTEAARA